MPRLSVLFVRTSLLYLAVGVTLGSPILWHKATGTQPLAWRLLPAHQEIVLMGWLLQLAMGVAYWILPRRRIDGRPTRGRERAAWTAFALVNIGLAAVALSPQLPNAVLQTAAFALGRLAEATAVGLFVWHAWPRIKAAGGDGRRVAGDGSTARP